MREPPSAGDCSRRLSRREGADSPTPRLSTAAVRELLDALKSEALSSPCSPPIGRSAPTARPFDLRHRLVRLHHYLGRVLGAREPGLCAAAAMGCITAGPRPIPARSRREIARTRPSSASCVKTGRAVGVAPPMAREILAPPSSPTPTPTNTFAELLPKALSKTSRSPLQRGTSQSLNVSLTLFTFAPSHPLSSGRRRGGASRRTARHGTSSKRKAARPRRINLAVTELPRFTCCRNGRAIRSAPNTSAPSTSARIWTFWSAHGDEGPAGYPVHEPMIEMYLQTATDPSLAAARQTHSLPLRASTFSV